ERGAVVVDTPGREDREWTAANGEDEPVQVPGVLVEEPCDRALVDVPAPVRHHEARALEDLDRLEVEVTAALRHRPRLLRDPGAFGPPDRRGGRCRRHGPRGAPHGAVRWPAAGAGRRGRRWRTSTPR